MAAPTPIPAIAFNDAIRTSSTTTGRFYAKYGRVATPFAAVLKAPGKGKGGIMLRRDMFRGLIAGTGTLLGLGHARAATRQSAARQKVAYHLADFEKVAFVLGNIRNHYDGTDGNVDIVLVVHGPALAAFKRNGSSAAVAGRFSGLVKDGLSPVACANTMQGMDVGPADLFEGFASAEEGGVVRLARLQAQGYAYLKP
jgi:intracellular sulfur oxidation DsrE/DsrF family protein